MPSPVEQIKERLNVVDVVSQYLRLEKAGANFKARCPFHTEKTPSFFVSPTRQTWHCFGCSRGGDMLSFVQEIGGLDFLEALHQLAAQAGIELKKEDPKIRSERQRLIDLLEEATRHYEKNLARNAEAGAYLQSRGMSGKTAKQFRIGYAKAEWGDVILHLRAAGYRETEIEKTGLALKGNDGRHHDRFRGRIMFPIADSLGRIVGFSGRIFEEIPRQAAGAEQSAPAKYINTPQTLLFDKSTLLFGFHHAKTAIRKMNRCVIVEGQMDVVLSHQAGQQNAVAVSGTALSAKHLALIKRLADTVILAFDPDAAGMRALHRSVEIALKENFDVRAALLARGKDPADMVKDSPASWTSAVESAIPFLQFFIDEFRRAPATGDAHRKMREASAAILPFIAMMPNAVDRAHWINTTSKSLGIREESLWEECKTYTRRTAGISAHKKIETRAPAKKLRRERLEERIIGIGYWKGVGTIQAIASCQKFFSGELLALLRALFNQTQKLSEEERKRAATLAFEAELFYGEEGDLASETAILASELERQATRDELEAMSNDIRHLETSGERDKLKNSLQAFHHLLKKLR